MRRNFLASDGRCKGANPDQLDAGLKASLSETATVLKSFTLKPSQFWGYRPTSSITDTYPIFVAKQRFADA